jgi:hypothetical protein
MSAVHTEAPGGAVRSNGATAGLGTDFWTWTIVVLGVGLRVAHYLRDPAVWHDEAALILNVLGKGFRELLGPLMLAEASPPLYLWLERAVSVLLGDSTCALRLVSVLASSLAMVLMVPLGRRVLQPRAVPWALLLFACSDRLLWHACEAKPYSLDVLMAVALPAMFCLSREWNLALRLVLFTALAPLTIFLVYPGCFLFGAVLVAFLPDVIRMRRSAAVVLAYAVLVIATFGAFAILVAGPVHAQRCDTLDQCWEATFVDWSHPWSVPSWYAWTTVRIADYNCRPVGGAMIFLAVIGVFSLWRRQRRLLVLIGLPPLLALVASLFHAYPYTGARVMVFAAPALILLIAEGTPPALRWLRRKASRVPGASRKRPEETSHASLPPVACAPGSPAFVRASVVGTATLLLYALVFTPVARTVYRAVRPWERPDAAAASAYVLAHRQPNDAVVAGSWEYLYYFRHLGKHLLTPEQVLRMRTMDRRIWVILTGKVSSTERLEVAQELARGEHRGFERREFADATVLFAGQPPSEARAEERIAAYVDGVAGEASFRDARRAMSAATYPPLKPLSMLTTTTLAEQLLSMVNKGATPEKAAP